jgi:hypothetical protein
MIRKVFSWSGILVDVTNYVKSCLSCQRIRPGAECMQGFVSSHPVEGPFNRVHMDIYETTIDNVSYYVLTMIDNHTKWVECKVIQSKAAVTIAETFVKEWVCRFGCPSTLVIDNEKSFVGTFMSQLCQILGTKHLPTTTCHPDANSPIESFHRVLSKGFQRFMIESPSKRLSFDEVLQLILFGYRTSFHSTTQDTPAYLALGIDPNPPVASLYTRCQPVHQERIQVLNTIREDIIQKAYIRHIQQFKENQRYRSTNPLQVGELVLLPIDRAEAVVHAVNFHGRKVAPKYSMPYRVIRVFNQGRSAQCRNLCPISASCSDLREVSIQNLRRILPPIMTYKAGTFCFQIVPFYVSDCLKSSLYDNSTSVLVTWSEVIICLFRALIVMFRLICV